MQQVRNVITPNIAIKATPEGSLNKYYSFKTIRGVIKANYTEKYIIFGRILYLNTVGLIDATI